MTERSGLTFGELITRVAETAGVQRAPVAAGEVATLPTSSHHLDKAKRAINDAMSVLTRDYGRWHGLRRTYSLTLNPTTPGADSVDGNVSHQRLEAAIMLSPNGKWTAQTPTGYRGYLGTVALVDLLAKPETSGFPAIIAFEPLRRESADSAPVWSVRVWPTPTETVIIEGQAVIRPAKLVNDSDRHPFGAEHDMTLLAAALVEMYRGHPDRAVLEAAKADYRDALGKSVSHDLQHEPASLGTTTMPQASSMTPKWGGLADLSALTG